MRPRPLEILSLGAGVQSSCVLLMSCKGVLPNLDAAVFADTGWESDEVYENLAWLETQAGAAGIPVYRTSCGKNIREQAAAGVVRDGRKYQTLPVFVLHDDGKGRIRRQCTREYKIRPVERCIKRSILNVPRYARLPLGSVRHWFGISSDEVGRVRTAREPWQVNVYPLCGLPDEMLGRPFSRSMCQAWLADHFPSRRFPRSACLGCPNKSNLEWAETKKTKRWSEVVEVDASIREQSGKRGDSFLHGSCLPLAQVDLDENQGGLWDEQCSGYCGV